MQPDRVLRGVSRWRHFKPQPAVALCNLNFSFIHAAPFAPPPLPSHLPHALLLFCFCFFPLFTVRNGASPPYSNSTQPGGSLGATVQIRARLATACNSLKFNVIFRSPMGTPFACRTAVTNRCNLFIMSCVMLLVHWRFLHWWRVALTHSGRGPRDGSVEVKRGFDGGSVMDLLRAAEEAPPLREEVSAHPVWASVTQSSFILWKMLYTCDKKVSVIFQRLREMEDWSILSINTATTNLS